MAEFGISENSHIPRFADAQYLPGTIPWLRQKTGGGLDLGDKDKSDLINIELDLRSKLKWAEQGLSEFDDPVSKQQLLTYSSLAARAGDINLMELVCARMSFGFPELEFEGEEEKTHLINLADVFYATALVYKNESYILREAGYRDIADFKMREAKYFYSRYRKNAEEIEEVYAHNNDIVDVRTLHNQNREKRLKSYFEHLDLLFSPEIVAAADEAETVIADLDPELNDPAKRSDIDQIYIEAGVDTRWLSVKNGILVNKNRFPEANKNYDLLIQIAAHRHNIPKNNLASIAAVLSFESEEAMRITASRIE